jgi:hypothetical protein
MRAFGFMTPRRKPAFPRIVFSLASCTLDGRIRELIDNCLARWTTYSFEGVLDQHFLYEMFHQSGEHRNLLDQQFAQLDARAVVLSHRTTT